MPGASISGFAFANGLDTNQLFTWRRQLLTPTPVRPAVLQSVEMEAPVPVVVNVPAEPVPARPTLADPHIEITRTQVTVRVHGQVDPATLRTGLQWLAR